MRHKIIATLLAISLVVGMVPITAFAEGENEQDTGVAIDEENFPDENFRDWVFEQDWNNDGSLSAEEIENVTSPWLDSKGIKDLKGIEYFTNLTNLNCSYNDLISLDVTGLQNLIGLNCSYNDLTSLDVTGAQNLESLYCRNNELTSLDVTGLQNLTELDCSYNKIAGTLDVSNCPELKRLYCHKNLLTDVKLCGDASYEEIDVRYNELPEEITIEFWPYEGAEAYYSPQDNNKVYINEETFPDPAFREYMLRWDESVDDYKDGYLRRELISNDTWLDLSDMGIKDLKGIEYFTNLEELDCNNNELSGILDLSMLKKLRWVELDNNQLTGLVLIDDSGYDQVSVKYNRMSSKADVTVLDGDIYSGDDYWLEFYPQGSVPQDVEINETNFPDDNFRAFVKDYDEGRDSKLTAKELEEIASLYEYEINGGIKDFKGIEYLTSLRTVALDDSVAQNLMLPDSVEYFSCNGCDLSELPELPADLRKLDCGNNKLTRLPTLPIYLQDICLYGNQLTGTLDVSKLNYVSYLECTDNNLTGVKLSAIANYDFVVVMYNYLLNTSDVTGRSGITWDKDVYYFSPQKNSCEITGKHNYNSYKIIKKATCTANGSKVYTCSGCGATKTGTIKATGHKYKVTKVNTKATTKKNGKITKQCTVCKKKVTETIYRAKSISLSKTKFTYNGKTQKPKVTVKDSKGKVISSSNYKVSFSKGCKNAGTYKVTVTFKGQYSGKLTKSFKISKAKPKITAANFTKVKGDKAFSINAKVAPKGGKVTYKTSNKKVATVSSKGKVTIKGKGKATITITSASNKNCSKVTKKITVTVK